MTKDEALKLALQALENLDGIDTETECVTIDVGEEITAIREALAQPDQEPVAAQHRFRHPQKTMPDWSAWQPCKIKHGRPAWEFDSQGYEVEYRELYTSPQAKPWVGLTDEETITQANKELFPGAFARGAIWAQLKLKEKNT